MKNSKTLDPAVLAHFTGSEHFYRHSLARQIIYTDGAKYVAETAGAYWLLDEIALSQGRPTIKGEEFQVWKLKRNDDMLPGSSAELTCDDGNGRIVYRKKIEYTDFPEPEFSLWCVNKTIHLPSEY